jgi:hypothetical protein
MKADFRYVFGTPEGKRVLTKLLSDLCFFREDLDDEEVVLNNYAKQLLSYMEVWEEGKELVLVEKLMEASNVRGSYPST